MIERMNFDYDVDNSEEVTNTKTASISMASEAITLQDVAYAMKRFLLSAGYMVDQVTISTGESNFRSG